MLSEINQPYPIIFSLILISDVAAYIVGMVVGKKDADERRRFHPAGKVIMMLLTITVAAIIRFVFTAGSDINPYTTFILLGLIASLIGDLILAKLLPFKHTLLPGMIAFAVAHLFYLSALTRINRLLGLSDLSYFPLFFFAVALLYVFGWYRVVRPAHFAEKGKRGLLVYGLLLVALTTYAVFSSLHDSRLSLIALGLTLFLLSDLILIGDLTAFKRFRYIGDIVWIIYAAGQMLIAFSPLAFL